VHLGEPGDPLPAADDHTGLDLAEPDDHEHHHNLLQLALSCWPPVPRERSNRSSLLQNATLQRHGPSEWLSMGITRSAGLFVGLLSFRVVFCNGYIIWNVRLSFAGCVRMRF
jgi:hypothetical protein